MLKSRVNDLCNRIILSKYCMLQLFYEKLFMIDRGLDGGLVGGGYGGVFLLIHTTSKI